MKKITIILGNSLTVFTALIFVWGILSFIEVNCHNREADYEYNKANMFVILKNIGEDIYDE